MLRRIVKFIVIAVIVIALVSVLGVFVLVNAVDGDRDRVASIMNHGLGGQYIVTVDADPELSVLPDFHIRLGAITAYEVKSPAKDGDEPVRGRQLLSLGSFELRQPLAGLFGFSKTIRALNVEKLHVAPALTGAGDVNIDYVRVERPGVASTTGALAISGAYEGMPVSANLPLDFHGGSDDTGFFFSYKGPVRISAGNSVLEGTFARTGFFSSSTDLDLKSRNIADFAKLAGIRMPQHPLELHVTISSSGRGFDIKTLKYGKSQMSGDIHFDAPKGEPMELDADLVLDALEITDFTAFEPINPAPKTKEEASFYTLLSPYDFDIDLDVKKLLNNGRPVGNLSTGIRISDGDLKIAPLGGVIAGGQLAGVIRIDSNEKNADMSFDLDLQDAKYQDVQALVRGSSALDGIFDVSVRLEGNGVTPSVLKKSLSGHFRLNGGDGTLSSDLYKYLAADILISMLPSLNMKDEARLNCLVANLDLKNGVANVTDLLLDSSRVTITGEGNINIGDNTIEVTLSPQPKERALLSLASRIRLRGSLDNMSIYPDPLDLGAKIGGMALGTVNPLATLLTMTEEGADKTDPNPCEKYPKP